jgi:methylenetetrahydrofolate reductase (NADPH)
MRSFSAVADKAAIQRCVTNYSVEVTPMAAKKIPDFLAVDGLLPGTTVNVTFLVGSDVEDTLSLCKRLQESGMRAVAHVPARGFPSLREVEEYFARLADLGVRELLVLGGGADQPMGSLSEAMQILESGLLQKYGFSCVGVAAHPEGHPDVSNDLMEDALLRKAEWAASHGIELYYETQFCFEPEPLIRWEQHVRGLLRKRLGQTARLPLVHLGVAGPAKIHSLIKFATMSGVGASMRFVSKYATNVIKLATTAAPDELVAGLASYQASELECLFQRLHFYTFGGLQQTLRWSNNVVAGNFELEGHGFSIKSS